MPGGGSPSGAGAGLTPRAVPPSPPGFRGVLVRGEEAARRASLVSGPFHARPLAYALPRDAEDLSRLLRWAGTEGIPVTARGAGTGMPGGNLGPGVVVELGEAFGREPEADWDGGRFLVGAGSVAGPLDRRARRRGWCLPPLPSSAAWCTVGGMVANNAAGARSFRYGATAAWVESLEGVFAGGEPFRLGNSGALDPEPFPALHRRLDRDREALLAGWPRVRKNASGYALDRFLPGGRGIDLLVGSEGTLALITRVGLRLARLPQTAAVVLLPAGTPADLAALARRADRPEVTACEFLGRRFLEMAALDRDPEVGPLARGAYALLVLEVAGTPDEVEAGIEALLDEPGAFGRPGLAARTPEVRERLWELRHAASPTIAREADRGRISTQFIEDCVVPPDRLDAFLVGLERILNDGPFDAVVFGHAGDGNVHVNPLVDPREPDWRARMRRTLDEVTRLVSGLGGTLAGEHGDGRLRAPLLPRIWSPDAVRAFREVKAYLDPGGTLNPGVILPLPGQDPLDQLRPRRRAHPTAGAA